MAVYFQPQNAADLTEKLSQVLNFSPSQKAKQIEKGKNLAKKYSWEKTAQETLEVYKKILKSILPYMNKNLCILLFETDPGISTSLKELIADELKIESWELKEIIIEKDYNQRDRIIKAVLAEKV